QSGSNWEQQQLSHEVVGQRMLKRTMCRSHQLSAEPIAKDLQIYSV
ncbi:unnamed protein product, partial [Staurois parvus]